MQRLIDSEFGPSIPNFEDTTHNAIVTIDFLLKIIGERGSDRFMPHRTNDLIEVAMVSSGWIYIQRNIVDKTAVLGFFNDTGRFKRTTTGKMFAILLRTSSVPLISQFQTYNHYINPMIKRIIEVAGEPS